MAGDTAKRKHGAALLDDGVSSARAATDAVCALLPQHAWYERPVPERHRLIFYLGHVEAFDWNLLARHGCGVPSFQPEFDRLFAFGIDPKPGQAPADTPSDWPSLEVVQRYVADIRTHVDDILADAPPTFVDVAIEHRLMHAETFTYLMHNLRDPLPRPPRTVPSRSSERGVVGNPERAVASNPMIEIPAGTATLGQAPDSKGGSFGWDNEFHVHEVAVPAFGITQYKVTNGEYLAFVAAGAPAPHFWRHHDHRWWWRTVWGEVPLPLDWPVYVTHREATAYARWKGLSLPTEAQFHRAAYGTPDGAERDYPWGWDAPTSDHAHCDRLAGNPVPVTANPKGDSAFGVSQLLGNGWEWTGTVFGPFPGFHPFSFYPGYSEPFFDGDHYVMKGGSACTAVRLLRRSFRNWFRPDYPHVYAGFRCVDC